MSINNNNRNNNTPGLRKNKISTLLVLSAATLMLLLTSTLLPLSNPLLLQSAQAQTTLSFRTPTPAGSSNDDFCLRDAATLTFEAQGTPSSNNLLDIASGTFKVTASGDEQKMYSGSLTKGTYTNNSGGGVEKFTLSGTIDNVSKATAANCLIKGYTFAIDTQCSTSNDGGTLNPVEITTLYKAQAGGGLQVSDNLNGVVDCSPSQGGGNTASSSMIRTTPTQDSDSDSDGIPDSSDRCAHNSNHRCFKEGDASTTQQQSSSDRTGNQTR